MCKNDGWKCEKLSKFPLEGDCIEKALFWNYIVEFLTKSINLNK